MKVKVLAEGFSVNGKPARVGATIDLSGAAARAAIDAGQVEAAPDKPEKAVKAAPTK